MQRPMSAIAAPKSRVAKRSMRSSSAPPSEPAQRLIERDDAAENHAEKLDRLDLSDTERRAAKTVLLPRSPEELEAHDKKIRNSERMRGLSERSWENRGKHQRETVKEPASPGNGSSDPIDWQKQLASDLNTEVQRGRAERIISQDRAATVKAERETERYSDGGGDRESEVLRQRIRELETHNAQMQLDMKLNAFIVQQNAQFQDLKGAVQRLVEAPRQPSNGHSQIADVLAVARELRPPDALQVIRSAQEAGIVGRADGGPTSELAARRDITIEKMRNDREDRTRKEVADTAMQDRVLQLGDRAIQVIADPISRAVADSMRTRASLPPGAAPAQAQSMQAGPPTAASIEEKLRLIQAHKQEVAQVEANLTAQLQQLPAPMSPSPDRVEQALADSMRSPTGAASAPVEVPLPFEAPVGQVHAHAPRHSRRRGG